jgi:hypothetical protein
MKRLMNVFNEVCNEKYFFIIHSNDLAGKLTVSHIYDRSGRTFVPNVPIQVKSIVAERTYAGFTEFLNPYL